MTDLGKLLVLLVTGSREYDDEASVRRCLSMALPFEHVLVLHGGCPRGADALAHAFLSQLEHPGMRVVPMPADWQKHGNKAGPIRHQQMVDRAVSERAIGARIVCVAFWDGVSSRTRDCIRRAVVAGIETAIVPPEWVGLSSRPVPRALGAHQRPRLVGRESVGLGGRVSEGEVTQPSSNHRQLTPAEVADLFLEGWSIDALAARQSCSTECVERVLRKEFLMRVEEDEDE